MHHDNVLDFGERGWLVIDPKRLTGERTFDYANIFCNPDLSDPVPPVATVPGCFERRLQIVVDESGLERRRLLQWVVAWCGLSAAWYLGDGDDAAVDLNIAHQALALLRV
jgi:streptomycin 6-kinase